MTLHRVPLHRVTPLPIVLVAGNPNSGKSTLFNALTGARAHVANYPGVTIDRVAATLATADGSAFELVDLPGTYGLSARSREEQIAVDALIGHGLPAPQAVVVVVDAATLARSLFLAIEVIATGVPVVIALNMSDEAARDGITIDEARLASMTGAEVVRTVATRGKGLDELKAAIARAVTGPAADAPPIERPAALAVDIAELETAILAEHALGRTGAARAWATWLLLSLDDEGADDLAGVPPPLRALTRAIRRRAAAAGRNVDLEIIASSYRRVDAIVEAVVQRSAPSRRRTDRIDAVLTHGVYGAVVFALVMLVVFQALFTWSEPAIALIESMVAAVQGLAASALPPGPLTDLVINGIIAGVGNVVVFVPQIGLLFLFIGLLEDSGYLARVAFVIDRLMRSVGLNGRAFVPMLSGFSCAVPAVMATRTIENRTDRLLTMLVLPLMSCSARLPVYVLVTATVFAPGARLGVLSMGAVVLFAMYLLSVVAALTAAAVLRRTVLKGPGAPLVLELPPYRLPATGVLMFNVWQRVRAFLIGAGTVILALTIILWALLSYPKVATEAAGDQLRHSFAGRLGHVIEPAIEPLGFDWRIGVGIIGAFAAREVFVSTLAIVFDIESDGAEDEPLREALRTATWPDGRPLMTPLAGVSLMVFFVLACQCMSTVAVVRRESGTWRWPLFMVAYMTLLAYGASLVVYQVGARLGLGLS